MSSSSALAQIQDLSLPPNITFRKEYVHVEEDQIAQVTEIFKAFDQGNRGRITVDQLPQLLRLLNKNISEVDAVELQYEIDKKHRGYFTLNDLIHKQVNNIQRLTFDLIQLLSEFQFEDDSELDVLRALEELDQGADGFIHKDLLVQQLTSMGEVFTPEEVNEFVRLAMSLEDQDDEDEDKQEEVKKQGSLSKDKKGGASTNHDGLIDIRKLAKVLVPKIQARKVLLEENLGGTGSLNLLQ